MTPPLFLVAELGDDVVAGAELALTGAEAHHAARVKRLAVGELALLSDGRGGLAQARVASVSVDRVLFTVLSLTRRREPEPRLVVVQAVPKGERADLAVEALTELGADMIVPWAASRSVSVWRGDKAGRGVAKWRRTAAEASKQSRRSRVPVVAELASTAAVADRIRAAAGCVVLHESAGEPLASIAPPAAGELVVVVGPEGGVSEDELRSFVEAGARPVRLGPEVLRTATAGAAALAVLSVSTGRWR